MADDNIHEEWRPVVGWEDIYSISSFGRLKRISPASGATIGRILNPKSNSRGYILVSLHRNGDGHPSFIHTLVTSAFIGPRPKGYEVNHINGIKHDNRLSNLEYVTPSENRVHAYKNGLIDTAVGQRVAGSKLTKESVISMRRERIENGTKYSVLAKKYGVTDNVAREAVVGHHWKCVPEYLGQITTRVQRTRCLAAAETLEGGAG